MAWYYDDFVVGRQASSTAREISAADVAAFAELTGDYHPLHSDAAYAATTEFGGPIVHGLLGLGVAAGLLYDLGIVGDGVLALLGIGGWEFVAPVRPGDSVAAVAMVRQARPSRQRLDRGIVTVGIEVLRDDGVIVQRGELTLLVRRAG